MSKSKFSATERKVRSIAARGARGQLLRVSWPRFRKAYEEYPYWQALALWAEAVTAAQGTVPGWLVTELRERCPGLMGQNEAVPERVFSSFQFLGWVHSQPFGYAKRQGWLGALTFYGIRHFACERAWAYWERCDREWSRRKPMRFPAFDKWYRQAQQGMLFEQVSNRRLLSAVEKYFDWEALTLWLEPLFAANVPLPPQAISELKHRGLDARECQTFGTHRSPEENSKIWRRVKRSWRDKRLCDAKEGGWLGALTERVRSHPRHARLVIYGKHWARTWLNGRSQAYPALHEWRKAADGFTLTDED